MPTMNMNMPSVPASWTDPVRHLWSRVRGTNDNHHPTDPKKPSDSVPPPPEHFDGLRPHTIAQITLASVAVAIILAFAVYLFVQYYWIPRKARTLTAAGGQKTFNPHFY